jgi:uncharacterized OB-fold protein
MMVVRRKMIMVEISEFYIKVSEARRRVLEQQSSYDKALPMKTTITGPFWEGLRHHEFLLQKCRSCGKFIWYPRAWCIYCGGRVLDWQPSSGKGTIYSFVVIRQVVENSPSWSKEIPFTVAEVDLEEGVRVYGKIIKSMERPGQAINDEEIGIEQIQIGDHAQIVFEDISPDATLFGFEVKSRTD